VLGRAPSAPAPPRGPRPSCPGALCCPLPGLLPPQRPRARPPAPPHLWSCPARSDLRHPLCRGAHVPYRHCRRPSPQGLLPALRPALAGPGPLAATRAAAGCPVGRPRCPRRPQGLAPLPRGGLWVRCCPHQQCSGRNRGCCRLRSATRATGLRAAAGAGAAAGWAGAERGPVRRAAGAPRRIPPGQAAPASRRLRPEPRCDVSASQRASVRHGVRPHGSGRSRPQPAASLTDCGRWRRASAVGELLAAQADAWCAVAPPSV